MFSVYKTDRSQKNFTGTPSALGKDKYCSRIHQQSCDKKKDPCNDDSSQSKNAEPVRTGLKFKLSCTNRQ